MSTCTIVIQNLIKFTQYFLLMQVNKANVLKPKGMLYNALHYKGKIQQHNDRLYKLLDNW